MAEKKAYSQAVGTGKYDKSSGLLGKYDNVRRSWEDAATALFLSPVLSDLIAGKKEAGQKLRVLDLGCGSADGYELLLSVPANGEKAVDDGYIVKPEYLEQYIGVDINRDLLNMAEDIYGPLPTHRFVEADISHGLPSEIKSEKPFDLYFTSYGTLSHFHDDENAELIASIAEHAEDGAVFAGDWLGRYSYEWQDLWNNPVDREYFMDYRISYIYPEEERKTADIASFPLRLMTRREILSIIEKASRLSGTDIRPVLFFDRSILIGRHMETGDYNKNCPKLRTAVNSLLEPHMRTELSTLKTNYEPLDGFGELNSIFQQFFTSVNNLVDYTSLLLQGKSDEAKRVLAEAQAVPPLKAAMESMDGIFHTVSNLQWIDGRADFIEPMLGYCLRKLEMELQPGTGVGHGLVGLFRISK